MALPRVILASASPRRAELMRQLNVEFEVIPSDIPEVDNRQLTPFEIAQINAHRKARSISKRFPDFLVLGADTVVSLDGQLFGKPRDIAEAQQMLQTLQGRTHEVVTGVCLTDLRHRRERLFAEITLVSFQTLTPDAIRRYLASINPLDKAGGYAIQERGDVLVQDIEGSYTNVVGLPMERLRAEFKAWES